MQALNRFTLDILEVTPGGDGLARIDGAVVFVPFTAAGDRVVVELTETHKSYARGRVLTLEIAGPDRTEPPCPYYQRCGGCQYQHLLYPKQLAMKTRHVREVFRRIGKIADAPVLDIIASPSSYAYRNRITVHAEDGKIGFRGVRPTELIDVAKCLIALPEVNDALHILRAKKPKAGHYSVRHPGLPPSGFFQANHFLLDTLRDLVTSSFPEGLKTIVDAYCGGGFFSAPLAFRFETLVGIEQDPRALRDAARLDLPNARFIEGAVEEVLGSVLTESTGPTGVLLDPPRTGLPPSVKGALLKSPAETLTYVSCDPATLARDAKELAAGYDLISVQPIDLFPQTSQIECVTLWKRRASPAQA